MPDDSTAVVADASASVTTNHTSSDAPWFASTYAPDKPGELDPDRHRKAPEEERQDWERYRDAKSPWEIAQKAHLRVKEAQTALRNRAEKDGGLPVRPEGDAATPEAWKAYREAHGLPLDPKEYGLAKPKDYPDALWNDKESEEFAAFALENDMKPSQVKALAEWYQQRGLLAWAAHNEQRQIQAAAEAKAKADYIQTQKETVVTISGVDVDRDLKRFAKVASIAIGEEDAKALTDINNPDTWMGDKLFKVFKSISAMIPKGGDSTARELGRNEAGTPKDRAYFANVIKDPNHPDTKALANPNDPRHKMVVEERNLAYELDAQRQDKK